MLLGLLGTAALVTVITVPVVLLNKGSKFETFEKDKAGGDQDLVLFYPTEVNKGFCWGLKPEGFQELPWLAGSSYIHVAVSRVQAKRALKPPRFTQDRYVLP